jgi:hypothetical protein
MQDEELPFLEGGFRLFKGVQPLRTAGKFSSDILMGFPSVL